MDPNTLFKVALGLQSPWEVKSLDFSVEAKRLDILVDFEPGSTFPCPECGRPAKAHDTVEKSWRHLDFFQHAAYLTARVPRCKCDEHGVRQVQVPWARPGSGFTLLFEALLMALVREMPVAAVARIVDEHDTRIWRMVDHYVGQALEKLDLSDVSAIGVDETAARRGHDYITLFMDQGKRRLMFAIAGRDHTTVAAFNVFLKEHGGDPARIQEACIDMSNAFIKGFAEAFPDTHLTFDRFHVMKLMGDAVDKVRREESKERPELKRTRWFWQRNPENLRADQRERLRELQQMNLDTATAYQMKLTLQDFYEQPNPRAALAFLEDWCELAIETGLEPVKKVALTLAEHAKGVLRWFRSGISNGLLEGINSIIQATKAKARGYSTTKNLITIAYLIAGKLDLKLAVL
ncbi:MAG: ISL3 family transposase [Nitrospiraceae bacterium]